MQTITFSQLRTCAAELKSALKRGEHVNLTSHGEVIATIEPLLKAPGNEEKKAALEAFFQLGEEVSLDDALARIQVGRKGRVDAV